LDSFEPLFSNPHLLTIAGNYWPRRLDVQRFPVREKLYQTEPGVQILVHSQQPSEEPYADLIIVHGLEGSSDAGYARSLAQAALESGCAVHRFNMRSCGGTEALCAGQLYHSGQTGDLLAVARVLQSEAPGRTRILAGFSLGGNVVLKLAGELGASASGLIAAVAAVSTPIDLAACARRLDAPSNILYARRFLSRLKERIRSKERLLPGTFNLDALPRVRTIWEFDDEYTAPSFGFGTAANYYATQSSNQFLDSIRIPALVVQAKDDPLIPFEVYDHRAFSSNPLLHFVAVDRGGHLGFVARRPPRLWLDGLLMEWMAEMRNKVASPAVP
jgi:predicted alpha/beta-fold hydrolase